MRSSDERLSGCAEGYTQTIELHLYTAGLDSSEKRQIPVSSTFRQDQDIYLPLDGIGLRLCPVIMWPTYVILDFLVAKLKT